MVELERSLGNNRTEEDLMLVAKEHLPVSGKVGIGRDDSCYSIQFESLYNHYIGIRVYLTSYTSMTY